MALSGQAVAGSDVGLKYQLKRLADCANLYESRSLGPLSKIACYVQVPPHLVSTDLI